MKLARVRELAFISLLFASSTDAGVTTGPPVVYDTVSLRRSGAAGDGVTDDTAAFQTALSAGKNIVCNGGDVHLVNGGMSQSTANQVIDMTGCTIKLKNSATTCTILRLNGAGAKVIGGEWNMNATNNASCPGFNGGYGVWAVFASGDQQTVDGGYIHDSTGLCVNAVAATHLTVSRMRLDSCAGNAIYVDSITADTTDITIRDNWINYSATPISGAGGVSVVSNGAHTIRRIRISNNTVIGPLVSAGTTTAILARGVESTIIGNTIRGTGLGISVDRSDQQNCEIIGNNIQAINGTTSFGIELNGGYCTIANNYIQDSSYGIDASAPTGTGNTLDHLLITGNVITNQQKQGISLTAGAGQTGRYLNISDNIIATPVVAGTSTAIYLTGDFKYSLIHANTFHGPGSGAGGVAVFLDTVTSDIRIDGNRFSGWTNASAAYNAGAVAQDRIVFANNDVSNDVSQLGKALVVMSGSAVVGSQVQIFNNFTGTTTSQQDWLDVANDVQRTFGSFGNPEGSTTAGTGSLWSTLGGAVYLKSFGSGNTGWRSLTGLSGAVTTDLGTVAANTCAADVTVTVTGAKTVATTGDTSCVVGMPATISAGLQGTCFVSAADTVKLRVCNGSSSSSVPGSLTYDVRVFN